MTVLAALFPGKIMKHTTAALLIFAGLSLAPATAQVAHELFNEVGGNDCTKTGRNAPITDGNGTSQAPSNVIWCTDPTLYENPLFDTKNSVGG